MDLQSALVCVLIFVISAVILILISMFGMKEKSYEEALAEQRKLTSGLLGTGQRPKPKEKKQKKAGKKMKEKAVINILAETAVTSDTIDEPENTVDPILEVTKPVLPAVESTVSTNSHSHHNLHVEFGEPPVIEQPQQTNKKRSKKEKVRSILINKEKSPVRNANNKEPPLNHFEKIHPKDEFELLHLHKKEKIDQSQKHEKQESEIKEKGKSAKNKQSNIESEQQKNKNKVNNVDPISEQQKSKNKNVVTEPEPQKTKNKSAVLEPEQQKIKNKTTVTEVELQKVKNKSGGGEPEMQKSKNKSTPIDSEQQKTKNKNNGVEIEQQKIKNKPAIVEIEQQKMKNKMTTVVENESQKSKTKQVVVDSEQQKMKNKLTVDSDMQKAKLKQVPVESEVQKVEKKASKTQKQQTAEKVDDVRLVETVTVFKLAPVQQNSVNSAKDKKKKKSEFNTLQQMTSGDRQGVNVSLLVPLVRKADLSRSEIQILIDLLLNKQHEAPAILDEWSEGRADPVQKLKKQLAEKERALTEEQEAMVGVQAKLREVRAELNSERSRLLQNCRNLEETLQAKHTEMQQMVNRHHTQNQKLQQMQVQLNEEIMTARKLREEHNAIQMQRQQMDMHLQTINEQQQEAEASFQSQLNQVRVELHDQQNLNSQLTMELRELREKSIAETEMLHERIRQIDSQAIRYKNESDQKQELVRQLEDSRRMYGELEHSFGVTHRSENELKILCQQHLDEARRLEVVQSQSQDDLSRLQSEVSRLNAANKQQQEENDKLITQLRSELTTLQNEKSKLESISKEAATNKVDEVEILNLQNELASLKVELQQKETQLCHDLELSKKSLKSVELELEEQRSKNNELRQKNWKVMEALSATEAKLRIKSKDSISVNEIIKQIKLEEQENNRKFFERLFPDLKIPNSDQWMDSAEKTIKKYLSTLETKTVPSSDNTTEINKLHVQITNYKAIIDDTEGMLKQLQTHVEQEERNWRRQLQEKEAEIEVLNEQNCKQPSQARHSPDTSGVQFAFRCIEKSLPCIVEELKVEIEDLQIKLESEQQAKQELVAEFEALKCKASPATDSKQTQFENLAGKEKLLEENSRLTEELSKEQLRCLELNDELLHRQVINLDSLLTKSSQNHASNGTSSLDIIDSESASNN